MSFTGHIRLACPQYGIYFILPFWNLEFAHGLHVLENSCAPVVGCVKSTTGHKIWVSHSSVTEDPGFMGLIVRCWVSGSRHLAGTTILSNIRTHSSSDTATSLSACSMVRKQEKQNLHIYITYIHTYLCCFNIYLIYISSFVYRGWLIQPRNW
jgi:hypothetical protein